MPASVGFVFGCHDDTHSQKIHRTPVELASTVSTAYRLGEHQRRAADCTNFNRPGAHCHGHTYVVLMTDAFAFA